MDLANRMKHGPSFQLQKCLCAFCAFILLSSKTTQIKVENSAQTTFRLSLVRYRAPCISPRHSECVYCDLKTELVVKKLACLFHIIIGYEWVWLSAGCHDIQYNEIYHNDISIMTLNLKALNINDTQHKNTQIQSTIMLSVITLSVTIYLMLCLMSLCRMSLC